MYKVTRFISSVTREKIFLDRRLSSNVRGVTPSVSRDNFGPTHLHAALTCQPVLDRGLSSNVGGGTASGDARSGKKFVPAHNDPMHFTLIPPLPWWSMRSYENADLLAFWVKSGDITLPLQNPPKPVFPDFRSTGRLTFSFLMPSTVASFIKCGIMKFPVSPPPDPVLMAYKIKSGIIVRKDQLPSVLVFSDHLPIFKDVVVTYYRDEKTGPRVSVHGIWFNNVVKGKLVTLRNQKDKDHDHRYSYEKVLWGLLRNDPDQVQHSIWAPPEGGMYQLQAYEYVTHNIYRGRPIMPTYLAEVPLIASPFVDSILPFIRSFEMALAKAIKENDLENDLKESALDLCSKVARQFYGKNVRIAVKEISKDKKKVEFGFLLNPEDDLVDHIGDNRCKDILKF